MFYNNTFKPDGVPEGVNFGGFFAKGCLSIGMEVLDGKAEDILCDSNKVLEVADTLIFLAMYKYKLEVGLFAVKITKVLIAVIGWLYWNEVVTYLLKWSLC